MPKVFTVEFPDLSTMTVDRLRQRINGAAISGPYFDTFQVTEQPPPEPTFHAFVIKLQASAPRTEATMRELLASVMSPHSRVQGIPDHTVLIPARERAANEIELEFKDVAHHATLYPGDGSFTLRVTKR